MKQANRFLITTAALLLAFFAVTAQTPVTKCNDPAIEGKASGIKSTYEKQGKVVFQESMLAMESMEPVPVAVRLQAGISYDFIFVGSSQATRLTLELFDGSDKKLDVKTEKNSDYLVYNFRPLRTEVYLITVYQKKGVKDICGYFGIMTPQLKNQPVKQAPVRTPDPAVSTQPKQPAKANTAVKPLQSPASSPSPKTPTQAPPQAAPAKKTTPTYPDNQRPNPNRTRATDEYRKQQEQQK
ncbi:MAG TPA: hypothetical protein VL098_11965 [Flavipsychrobacter sp.]|nr:hypothetical protein [Flavipsychrobacter sp.]